MSTFVRARGAYTFNRDGRSANFVKGELVSADHWAVVDDDSRRFEPVADDDPEVLRQADARRARILEYATRTGQTAPPGQPTAGERANSNAAPERLQQQPSGGPFGHVRDLARRTVEGLHRSGDLPSHAAEKVDRLVTDGPLSGQGAAARWAVATGNPDYLRAFSKLLADPSKGHMLWSSVEQRAFQAVEEMRAMSLTDAEGGFLVPLVLDPAVMLTSDGSVNPLRRVSRIVQTSTDSWRGITSAGVTAEWLAEEAEAADASPTIDQPSIPVHKGSAFIPYSYEVGMDATGFLSELQKLLNDGADQLNAVAYTTGSGTGQPAGVVTGLTGTASEVASVGADAYARDDITALQESVPARFRTNGRFMMNLSVINMTREFAKMDGGVDVSIVDDSTTPPRLRGWAIEENSGMDGTITATADNRVAIAGDFRAGFVIVDRIGTRVELIPNLMGANRRPTGQRGVFMYFRTGSEVVVPEALRMLNVT